MGSLGVPQGAVAAPSSLRHSSFSAPCALTVHHRTGRHWTTSLLQLLIRPIRPAAVKPSRTPSPLGSQKLQPSSNASSRCHVQENQVEGIWTYNLTPRVNLSGQDPGKGKPGRRRIIYFAGGGWQMPPSKSHWALCAELACRLPNTTVTVVSYPLAPKNPVSVAFPQLEKLYLALLDHSAKAGERVVVAGDSSGGNIALSLVIQGLNTESSTQHIKHPVAVMVISPSTDLRHEDARIEAVAREDPILTVNFINSTATAWCPAKSSQSTVTTDAEWTVDDPRVSPVRADLTRLVEARIKIHGVIGTYDVLGPETITFSEKCQKKGVQGEWLYWEGQMHCFPLAFSYGLKDSKDGLNWVIDLLEKE